MMALTWRLNSSRGGHGKDLCDCRYDMAYRAKQHFGNIWESFVNNMFRTKILKYGMCTTVSRIASGSTNYGSSI